MIEKTTTQQTLGFFCTYPTRSIYLRELSRQLKRSMPAILGAVRKLEKEQLVIVERGKALTVVRAHTDPRFRRVKQVHNLSALYSSGLVDQLLRATGHPQAIICFGSYARGEDTEQSDVDIAILGGTERNISLEAVERFLARPVSLHFLAPGKISPAFRDSLANGIVLEGMV